MRPRDVPVRGDGRASRNRRGELRRTGCTIIVASDGGVSCVLDGVAIVLFRRVLEEAGSKATHYVAQGRWIVVWPVGELYGALQTIVSHDECE